MIPYNKISQALHDMICTRTIPHKHQNVQEFTLDELNETVMVTDRLNALALGEIAKRHSAREKEERTLALEEKLAEQQRVEAAAIDLYEIRRYVKDQWADRKGWDALSAAKREEWLQIVRQLLEEEVFQLPQKPDESVKKPPNTYELSVHEFRYPPNPDEFDD